MAENDNTLLFIAIGIAALYMLSKKDVVPAIVDKVTKGAATTTKVASTNIGEAAGNVASGAVVGITKGLLINPYEWAKDYEGHIPIIDTFAKGALAVKRWGRDDRWFG